MSVDPLVYPVVVLAVVLVVLIVMMAIDRRNTRLAHRVEALGGISAGRLVPRGSAGKALADP